MVERGDEFLVGLGEGGGESVEPGGDQRLPAQHLWLHIDHATPGHLRGGGGGGGGGKNEGGALSSVYL